MEGGTLNMGNGSGTGGGSLNVEGGTLNMDGGTINNTLQTPASSSDTGTTGTIRWDADYIYICTATDNWKRVAISTWP
jgi:hypothetical protein